MPDNDTDAARGAAPGGSSRAAPRQHAAAVASLLALVGVAAVLRLALLGDQPGGLFQDEAAEGWDAWRILHVSGFHPLFFDDDGGREPLFAYLVAAVFRLAGSSVTALRATAAVIGVLGVAATPLLLRRQGRVAALAATAWAATSLWLVCVERDGMRNTLVPLVGTLALAALVAWAWRPSRRRAALAGGLCGLGLWTYQPLKLLPLLAVLWLLGLRRRRPAAWPELRASLGVAALAYAAVAAPLVYVAISDPAGYFGRGVAVSAVSPDQGVAGLPLHSLRTLGMFGALGDPNPRHDAGGVPLVPLIPALLCVAGALRAWRRRDDPLCSLLLLGVPVLLLPALVATEGGAPHGLRLLGLAPVVAGLVGLGAAECLERAGCAWPGRGRRLAGAAAAAALALTAGETALAYFGRGVVDRYDAYSFDVVALAEAAPPGSVVVLDDYRALVVRFLDRDAPPRLALPGTALRGLAPGTAVLARSREDLDAALGPAAARAASVVARSSAGTPVAWEVRTG